MGKKRKEKELQYFQSRTNMKVLNYNVYYFSVWEKVIYTLIAFAAGCGIGYLFYGGLGKDAYGNNTMITYICNAVISCIVGIVATRLFLPVRNQQLLCKRKKELRNQFVDMLDALSTSLSAGKNVHDSFQNIYSDLKMQYGEDAYITYEVKVILKGFDSNIPVEDSLLEFGKRSGIHDIENFANVFATAFRKGGNLKEIIKNTHAIIHDKVKIEMDIEALVASNQLEQNIMIILPVFLVGVIKIMSPDFASNFATPSGILATTIAIISFVVAYFAGRKILNIKL